MAKLQRDAEKERRWREVLSRQASSGLSVREFCKRERLTESQFYAWRRTIAERDGESSPSFVPVVVNDQPKGDASIVIEWPCRLTPCEEGHAEQDEVVEEFAA